MAGYVSPFPHEKAEILSLLRRLEEDTVGKNVVAAKELLEKAYARQEEVRRRSERRRSSSSTGRMASEREEVIGVGLGLDIDGWDHHRHRFQGWGSGVSVPGDDGQPDAVDGWLGTGVDWVGLVQELGLQAANCRL